MAEDRTRMQAGRVFPLLDIDGARRVIDGFDASNLSCRGFNGVIFANLCVLGRELIAVNGACRGTANSFDENEARKAIAFFEQFGVRKLTQSEVLPPWRFLFAAMPLDHVREHL